MNDKKRILVWFSCGEASAVAAKETLIRYSHTHEVLIVCCDTRQSEHPDNYRFSSDCEKWFGQPIIYLRRDSGVLPLKDYQTIDDVFAATGYMAGIAGAKCTTELKKLPRLAFQTPDDIHVFGFTFDEQKRVREFIQRNPELHLLWVLVDAGIWKQDCKPILDKAGIKRPAMYELGFRNNNCPGCVKASSPWYWDKVRTHFPEVFKRRAEQSRKIGCRLVEIHHHERIFLDELPAGPFKTPRKKERLSCGPECASPGIGGQ